MKEGLKEFAIRHPFITWFCFGKLCDSIVHIVRGYPMTTTTTYRYPDEKGEEVELDEEEVTIEPETVNDESEEEA